MILQHLQWNLPLRREITIFVMTKNTNQNDDDNEYLKKKIQRTNLNQFPVSFQFIHFHTTKVKLGNTTVERILDPSWSNTIHYDIYTSWHHHRKGFPGSLAVSLEKQNLSKLSSNQYWFLPKTDGTRYLLFLFKNDFLYENYMKKYNQYSSSSNLTIIMERNGYQYILPFFHNYISNLEIFKGTLFDGELVKIFDSKNNKEYYEYQIFDCILYGGVDISKHVYSFRIRKIELFINKMKSNPFFNIIHKKPSQSIEDLSNWLTILKTTKSFHYSENYSFPIDGIIFIDENKEYCKNGKDENLLKLKFHHSIDFYCIIEITEKNTYYTLSVLKGNNFNEYSPSSIRDEESNLYKTILKGTLLDNDRKQLNVVDDFEQLHQHIIECFFDIKSSNWIMNKIRTDKDIPNNYETFQRTLNTIRDNLEASEIISSLKK